MVPFSLHRGGWFVFPPLTIHFYFVKKTVTSDKYLYIEPKKGNITILQDIVFPF